MDLLVQNQGLNHLAIEIFITLDEKSLSNCCQVHQSWKTLIQERKYLWVKKLKRLHNHQIKWRSVKMNQMFEFFSKATTVEMQAFMDFMIRFHQGKSSGSVLLSTIK